MLKLNEVRERICFAPDDSWAADSYPAEASGNGDAVPGGDGSGTGDAATGAAGEAAGAPSSIITSATRNGEEAGAGDSQSSEMQQEGGDGDPLDQVPAEGAYDFTGLDLPDGFELDTKLAETASPIMAEAALTQRQANRMADVVVAMKRQETEDWVREQQRWQEAAKTDSEIGGDNFNTSVNRCGRVMRQFGSPAFGEFLDQYGLGNHPEMIRFMARVGNAITEDEPGGSASSGGKEDPASILYPND